MTLMGLWLLYILKRSSLGARVTAVLYCPMDKLRLVSKTVQMGKTMRGRGPV